MSKIEINKLTNANVYMNGVNLHKRFFMKYREN